jgi:metal-responsive CopG/Arc/MetJ family transcriptional regulator
MDVHVDIDEELLREFDQAARAHQLTRDVAVRGAITAWLSQTRRDTALRELFDTEFDSGSRGGDR